MCECSSSINFPNEILDIIFSYLELKDLKNCALVCRSWYKRLLFENGYLWLIQCHKVLPPGVLSSDILTSVKSYRSKVKAFAHSWNGHDCSKHIFLKSDGFTLHRNPIAQSTDAIRGKIGFQYGRHAWDIKWESPLGTVAAVGVATREASLQCNGYVTLIGSNAFSWGWNLVENNLVHNGNFCGIYPLLANAPKYEVGEKIRVILDCEAGTLAFERNYEFFGIAFRDLPRDRKLYPCVSAVYGNSEIIMIYTGEPLDG